MQNLSTMSLLKKLKGWLLSGNAPKSNKYPGNVFVEASSTGDTDDPDGSARMGLLQAFTAVLDNHPEKKEPFFLTIEKIMDTNDPTSLSKEERTFMLDIVDEAMFSIDTGAPYSET